MALADYLPRVRNFNVAVSEDKGEVVFLHKIIPGGVDKSYGIHVAKLAGLPRPVIKRATEVLADLENHSQTGTRETVSEIPAERRAATVFLCAQSRTS